MERPNWEEKQRPVEEIEKTFENEEFETGTDTNDETDRSTGETPPSR
jgi:hypothetical protein